MKAAMVDMVADAFRYDRDADGEWVCIRTHDALSLLEGIKQGKRYSVDIKELRKKRGMSQNAMYWSVLTRFAGALGVTNNFAHNKLLRSYGQYELFGGKKAQIMIPDTEDAENQALEADSFHIKPTSRTIVGKDGNTYRSYVLMRGSHTYNTVEFSRLLDGLLSECELIGVDVRHERDVINQEGK